jgi:ribosomal protein L37E
MKSALRTEALLDSLMFRCLNWGDQECLSGVREFAEPEAKGPLAAAGSSYIPVKEIKRLNTICSGCQDGFFKIEKKVCLICGSNRVETVIEKGSASPPLLYVFKCEDCGRLLFSDVELKD